MCLSACRVRRAHLLRSSRPEAPFVSLYILGSGQHARDSQLSVSFAPIAFRGRWSDRLVRRGAGHGADSISRGKRDGEPKSLMSGPDPTLPPALKDWTIYYPFASKKPNPHCIFFPQERRPSVQEDSDLRGQDEQEV